MSDETSSLTNPIREGAGSIAESLVFIGIAIFAAIFVPLIGFLGIQFVQMGGNWWWAGMYVLGVGFFTLFMGWMWLLAKCEFLLWGMSVTVLMAITYTVILIGIKEKYSL